MEILSLYTHTNDIPNMEDVRSSSEHKFRYFLWNTRAFWSCIDRNTTDMFKTKKGSTS